MNAYRELIRVKLLTDILNKMTDDEKQLYFQHMANNSNKEMLQALKGQQSQLEYISKQVGGQSWLRDFASDVGANFLTDGIIWLGSRIIKKL